MAISYHAPSPRTLMPWALAWFAAAAVAQSPADAEASKAPLPTRLQYSSAISDYQAYTDQPAQSWRQANDRVGEIGGWRAYTKEAQAGAPAPAKDAAPVNAPHSAHHGGSQP